MQKKKSFLGILLVVIMGISALGGCNSLEDNTETKTMVDITGDEIEVPVEVNKIINLVPYGCQMMISLGLGDYLVGVNEEMFETEWIKELYPRIAEVQQFPYEVSAEAVLSVETDVVFVETQEQAREFRSKGITAITFTYYTIDELKENIRILGDVIGGDAEEKCDRYIAYLEGKIADVENQLGNVITDRETLYYINGTADRGFYKTTGNGSTNHACAELSYAEFVTASLIEAPESKVDAEAILAKNPENIIIGGRYQHVLYDELFESPEWSEIVAIKEGNVFKVPMSITAWNRYGVEIALMIPWTAHVVYPDVYEFDAAYETKMFYKEFMGYELSNEQVDLMLNGLMPNGEKEIPSR